MSTLGIVLVVIGGVLLVFFLGGLVAALRRRRHPEVDARIRAADRALEQARASDRGWDRDRMVAVAGHALAEQRPEYEWETIDLVLVDDRPGVVEDRAQLVAAGPQGRLTVVLARREGGEWFAEQVE